MLKVLFFAQIREIIGLSVTDVDYRPQTVSELLQQLAQRGDKWQLALTESTVLCAVNKKLVENSYVLQPDDEVAFFPPVTGG